MALSFIPGVGPLAASIGGAFGASGALASGIGMGLLTGGVTTLATGSLKQGLGAGLMGGIMGGLSAPSTAAAQTSNIATTTGADAATKAAQAAAQNTAVNTGLNQAGTSMMNNPSILNAARAPVAQTVSNPLSGVSNWWGGLTGKEKLGYGLAGTAGLGMLGDALAPKFKPEEINKGSIRPYTYSSTAAQPSPFPTGPTYDAAGNPILAQNERRYFNQGYTGLPAYKAANGGLMAAGGVSTFPQSQQYSNEYSSSTAAPMGTEVIDSGYEQRVNQYTGEPIGYALGGMTNLGDYSDGGRLLKGPGDGVSDSIPASIGGKQPARLADGEFVIPARIVSELGNGSTDAGAKRLYAMMDKIQAGRKKTTGKGKVAIDSKAAKHLPK
jgi:hypothetical protein